MDHVRDTFVGRFDMMASLMDCAKDRLGDVPSAPFPLARWRQLRSTIPSNG